MGVEREEVVGRVFEGVRWGEREGFRVLILGFWNVNVFSHDLGYYDFLVQARLYMFLWTSLSLLHFHLSFSFFYNRLPYSSLPSIYYGFESSSVYYEIIVNQRD